MVEVIIFDMDGVIVDSEPEWEKSKSEFFTKLGAKLTHEDSEKLVGTTVSDTYDLIGNKYGLKVSKDDFIRYYNDMAHNIYQKALMVENCLELIQNLKSCRFLLSIASSSPLNWVGTVVKRFGLQEYFDSITCGDEVKNGKPNPEIFLKAAEKLRKRPAQCIVIEDSKNGVTAAKAAGMKCIGFQNQSSSLQDLSKADMIVDDLKSITKDLIGDMACAA